MRVREPGTSARRTAVILLTAAALGVAVAIAARGPLLSYRADVAFAPLVREANRPRALAGLHNEPPRGRYLPASLVVLVRDFRDSSHAHPAYHLRTGLDWPIAFATEPSAVTLVLMVDRIFVDVRSYRPVGEDFQVVLHGTLVEWPANRVLREFVVRGPRPRDRAGWLTLFGLFDRTGEEPWPAAGAITSASAAAHAVNRAAFPSPSPARTAP